MRHPDRPDTRAARRPDDARAVPPAARRAADARARYARRRPPRPGRLVSLALLSLTVAALLGTAAVVGPDATPPTVAAVPSVAGVAGVAGHATVAATTTDAPTARAPLADLALPVLGDALPSALAEEPASLAADGSAKLDKKIAKLDKKLAKKQAKLAAADEAVDTWTDAVAQAELDVDAAELALAAAYEQLAAALAMPDGTPEELAAKKAALAAANKAVKQAKKALKAANKALKKANKKVAKFTTKGEKLTLAIATIIIKLEELEPGHFTKPVLAGADGVGQVAFSWDPVENATSYNLYWSLQPDVDPATAEVEAGVSSPFVASVAAGLTVHAVVTAVVDGEESPPSDEAASTSLEAEGGGSSGGPSDPSLFFPPWADVAPLDVITLDHDPGLSDTENGALLRSAVLALQPGDRLEVGGGTWSIASKFSPAADGTALAPIWVVAQDGETPVITRPDGNQNVMNPEGDYTCFRGLEFTGGSAGIKFGAVVDNVWIDQCHIHDVGETGIAANSADSSHLYITRNHIHDTGGYGEGMYLGANNGAVIMSESVIAQNWVHDTDGPGVLQGDGIEIKQGSWGNWVVENTVHDTKYPCLLLYGTNGQPVNVVERNVLVGSGDNVMQVQGEAIVRSNLIVDGATGFQSNDHQGQTRDLQFVHNTVVNSQQAVRLSNWDGRPGMVFANNAIYSQFGTAVQFSSGSTGVTIAGNVVFGPVSGAGATGFATGNGLVDFLGVAWSGTTQDATPSGSSALLGAGDPAWAVDADLVGDSFGGAPAAGAVAAP